MKSLEIPTRFPLGKKTTETTQTGEGHLTYNKIEKLEKKLKEKIDSYSGRSMGKLAK